MSILPGNTYSIHTQYLCYCATHPIQNHVFFIFKQSPTNKCHPQVLWGNAFCLRQLDKEIHKQDTISASPKSGSGTLEGFLELQFPDGHWLKFGITCSHCVFPSQYLEISSLEDYLIMTPVHNITGYPRCILLIHVGDLPMAQRPRPTRQPGSKKPPKDKSAEC